MPVNLPALKKSKAIMKNFHDGLAIETGVHHHDRAIAGVVQRIRLEMAANRILVGAIPACPPFSLECLGALR